MNYAWALGTAAMVAALAGGARAEAPDAVGFWVTQDHGAVVEIEPCDSGLCGKLVGLRTDHAASDSDYDTQNSDPAKRKNPRCGLLLMGSMKPDGASQVQWVGGWVYDPESGNTYSGSMRLEGTDTLKLRGYIGISLFGRTETWNRETGEQKNRCVPPAGH
jgi:uncharacterized protein (DUF2147 family)